MEELIAHFQANAVGYGVGAVCAAPIIYVTRKYSVPLILYILEFCIYATAMHVVFWLLVVVTKWFKEQSSMRALRPEDGKPEDAPEWATPLIEFWKREEYNPDWIWIVEVVFLVIILGLMWRYRPMKIQRTPKRATQEFGKSSARACAPVKPGVKAKPGFFGGSKGKRGR